jgi:hypothetical protein
VVSLAYILHGYGVWAAGCAEAKSQPDADWFFFDDFFAKYLDVYQGSG